MYLMYTDQRNSLGQNDLNKLLKFCEAIKSVCVCTSICICVCVQIAPYVNTCE